MRAAGAAAFPRRRPASALARYAVIGAAIRGERGLRARNESRRPGHSAVSRPSLRWPADRSRAPPGRASGPPLVAGCRRCRGRRRRGGHVGFLDALAGAAGREALVAQTPAAAQRSSRKTPTRSPTSYVVPATVESRADCADHRAGQLRRRAQRVFRTRRAAAICCPRWSPVKREPRRRPMSRKSANAADKAPDPHAQDPQ